MTINKRVIRLLDYKVLTSASMAAADSCSGDISTRSGCLSERRIAKAEQMWTTLFSRSYVVSRTEYNIYNRVIYKGNDSLLWLLNTLGKALPKHNHHQSEVYSPLPWAVPWPPLSPWTERESGRPGRHQSTAPRSEPSQNSFSQQSSLQYSIDSKVSHAPLDDIITVWVWS